MAGLHFLFVALATFVFQLDQVPAELSLDRVGDLPGLQGEGGLLELRDHGAFSEPAQIPSVLGRGEILGIVHGHLCEVLPFQNLIFYFQKPFVDFLLILGTGSLFEFHIGQVGAGVHLEFIPMLLIIGLHLLVADRYSRLLKFI